jgi:hypothetical protein
MLAVTPITGSKINPGTKMVPITAWLRQAPHYFSTNRLSLSMESRPENESIAPPRKQIAKRSLKGRALAEAGL